MKERTAADRARRKQGITMSMDYETVKFLRFVFAVVLLLIGAAAGFRYYGLLGAIGGAFAGYIIGWNTVDFFKGRAGK
jgi:hypothetical protein